MDTKPNSADIVRRQTGEIAPYVLRQPIKCKDGTEITTLHLRRPTGGQMRNIEVTGRKPYDLTLQIIEATCSLTRAEADTIDGADVTAMMEIVLPFLDVGTGERQPS
jgi:hypothetical protein